MSDDRVSPPGGKAASGFKDLGGCLLVILGLAAVIVVVVCAYASLMILREDFVPSFARMACRASGCGRVAMVAMGWAAWAAAVGSVTLLALLRRPRPQIFRLLVLPCMALVALVLLLQDIRYKRSRETPIEDLVVGIPNGDALTVGLHTASVTALLILGVVVLATFGVRNGRPRDVWAWQLARLAAPLMMLPALVIALARA